MLRRLSPAPCVFFLIFLCILDLVLAFDLHDLMRVADFSAFDDYSCQLSAFDTPGIESNAVLLFSQTLATVVAVDDGCPFVFGEGFLEYVPGLNIR